MNSNNHKIEVSKIFIGLTAGESVIKFDGIYHRVVLYHAIRTYCFIYGINKDAYTERVSTMSYSDTIRANLGDMLNVHKYLL